MRRSTPHHFGLLVVIAAALAVSTWMSVASASVLYADHFTYPDGNLVGQGTAPAWYAHSAGGSNPILVEGNRAKMGHRSTSS